MRLSDFCNRLQTRAPHRLPDSRVRPAFASRPSRDLKRDDVREPTLGQWPPVNPQVKLRLTANLQLQPCRNLSLSGALGLPRTRRRPGAVVPRGPGGASIECSSAVHLPAAAFSTASRACDVASDALCRDPPGLIRPFGRASPVAPPGVASAAVSSKTTASSTPGRLPSTSAVSPASRIIDSPPPCSRLCRREPASDTPSPRRARVRDTRRRYVARPNASPRRLPGAVADLDQVTLVDFCNQNNPRAQPQDRADPRSEPVRAARPACAGLGGKPLDGVEAIRHADHRIRVMTPDVRSSLEARRRRAEPRPRPTPIRTSRSTSRGLTGQGPAGFRRPAPPV